jgi:hypothetical protein
MAFFSFYYKRSFRTIGRISFFFYMIIHHPIKDNRIDFFLHFLVP